MAEELDYYAILGIDEYASEIEIKRAYHKLAKEFHPDLNSTPEAERIFKEKTTAYKVLQDPVLRSEYNRFRRKTRETENEEPEFSDIDAEYFSSVFGEEKDWDTREGEVLQSFYEYLKSRDKKKEKKEPKEYKKETKKTGRKRDLPPYHDHPLREKVMRELRVNIMGPKVLFFAFVLLIFLFLLFAWVQEKNRLIEKMNKKSTVKQQASLLVSSKKNSRYKDPAQKAEESPKKLNSTNSNREA